MSDGFDSREQLLADAFSGVEAPPALERWRERPARTFRRHSLAAPIAAVTVVALIGAGVGAYLGIHRGTDGTAAGASGAVPAPRTGAFMAYDAADQDVVMYGGQGVVNGQLRELQDTWVWDGSGWSERHTTNAPMLPLAMAYDPQSGSVVMLSEEIRSCIAGGACGPGPLAMWRWDGSNWQQLPQALPSTLTAGPDVSMTADPASGRLVLVDTNWIPVPLAPMPCRLVVPTDGVQPSCPTIAQPVPSTWVWTGSDWKNANAAPPPNTGTSYLVADPASRHLEYFTISPGLGGICPVTAPVNSPGPAPSPPAVSTSMARLTPPPVDVPPSAQPLPCLAPQSSAAPSEFTTTVSVSTWTGTGWTASRSAGSITRFVVPSGGLMLGDSRLDAVLFIGFGGGDTLAFNGSDWSWTVHPGDCNGDCTSIDGLQQFAAAYDAALDEIVVFGGTTGAAGVPQYSSQTWITGTGGRWIQRGGRLVPAPVALPGGAGGAPSATGAAVPPHTAG